MTSIYTEYHESHSRPADDSDGPWTAEQKARFAAARAVTVAEVRRAAKVGPSVRGPECDSPDAAPAAVTAPAPVAAPKLAPIILAMAGQTVEFRPQASGRVLIVSTGRTWSTLQRTTQAARNTYRTLLAAGFRPAPAPARAREAEKIHAKLR